MAQRIHHFWVTLIIETDVAELPISTVTKGAQMPRSSRSRDEAV